MFTRRPHAAFLRSSLVLVLPWLGIALVLSPAVAVAAPTSTATLEARPPTSQVPPHTATPNDSSADPVDATKDPTPDEAATSPADPHRPGGITVQTTSAQSEPTVKPQLTPNSILLPQPEQAPRRLPSSAAESADLLAPSARPSPPRTVVGGEQRGQANRTRYFKNLYRPTENPASFLMRAEGSFAMFGNEQSRGGRAVGLGIGFGQSWNYFSYSVDASLYAGKIRFTQTKGDPVVQNNILVGGGPTVGLGRLGLAQRSLLEVEAGYSFFYGTTAPVSSGAPSPDAVAPHGPRVRLNAGFAVDNTDRGSQHRMVGLSLGWQGLMHSFGGEYPYTNAFIFGLFFKTM